MTCGKRSGAALIHCGYSFNSTSEDELNEAAEVVLGWKRNLARFEIHDAEMGLGSGDYVAIHGYNGDIGVVMAENPDISV